jgi:hypothetical protein
LNSIISTDVAHDDKTDHVGSCSPLQQPESVVSVYELQQSLHESVEDPSHGVVGEYGTSEMISSKVTHSQPQLQHQDNPAIQNFKVTHFKMDDNVPFYFLCTIPLSFDVKLTLPPFRFMMYQAYEPDSRFVMPLITKIVDGQTAQSTAYPSEVTSAQYCLLIHLVSVIHCS